MAAPRVTFTREQLVEMGRPINAGLIQSFREANPELHIDEVIRRFKPVLEIGIAQLKHQLSAYDNNVIGLQAQINKHALELGEKRDAYYAARIQLDELKRECRVIESSTPELKAAKEKISAELKGQIISSSTAISVKVKDEEQYKALLAEYRTVNNELSRLNHQLHHNRKLERQCKEELADIRKSLVKVSDTKDNDNNESVESGVEAVQVHGDVNFSHDVEADIERSQQANKELHRINELTKIQRQRLQRLDEALRLVNHFDIHDPFVSIASIEAVLCKLKSLANVDIQDEQALFQKVDFILNYFAINKKTNADNANPVDKYIHQYSHDPRQLLQTIVDQCSLVITTHDDHVLHNQSPMVRKCIATLQMHIEIATKSMQGQNGFANDEAVRKYYRKILTIAQLYHQRLRELGETYLAELIENTIINHHLLSEPDVLEAIRKNDVTAVLFPYSNGAVNRDDKRLDVDPIIDLLNDGQLEKVEYCAYNSASKALDEKLDSQDQNSLLVQMVRLFKQDIDGEFVRNRKHASTAFDIKFNTKWLSITSNLLDNPVKHLGKFMKMLNVNTLGKPAISRRRKSLALAVAGAAIFAGALTLGCLSFGVLSPLSIAGMSLGVAMTVTGISVALTTGQKSVADYGESVVGISMFNNNLHDQENPRSLQVQDIMPNLLAQEVLAEQQMQPNQPVSVK